mmetsp:Transcript_23924/g.50413  ORF Transcript_23924/g.50413 Transcript_23924/m.50413 type:complete len:388 (-) Transcript_23924:214-1377(-)|eukprot:CAMPEP_0171342430 /NCGR_PEP_ID=MMETSP0878-20121228/14270_1 /TAXON_ID=67004 /ORGANISM="Thalassiosira weissflogii, Strain CCMP1336" /LENGTH=387 /DNA_ID=CAMNT_0011845093 /DNA_START=10 /DNA_END=1173 /DNA_ORIENTATION=+
MAHSTITQQHSKIRDFRAIFESSLLDIHNRTLLDPSECPNEDPPSSSHSQRCVILSGGVDTCAILSAAKTINMKFAAAFTVVTSEDSPDLGFARACAAEHGIPHHVVTLNADDLIAQFVPDVVRKLQIYNGALIRNSLVIAAVFRKASEMGFKDAIVGDGSDELFGGYSFMWGYEGDPAEWRKKRDGMCAEWTFSTEELASMYGMRQHSPYLEKKMVDWAIENTEREDCIGVRDIRLMYGGKRMEHVTGKVILREAYDTVASWRRKDPIEVGSGVAIVGHDSYWKDVISDEEFRAEKEELLKRGFRMRDKESLSYFRVFVEIFGPNGEEAEMNRLPMGEGCVDCCFDVGDKMFCHMCGAYPAQRSKAATHRYDYSVHKLVRKDGGQD